MKTFFVNKENPSSFYEADVKCPIAKGRDVLIRVKSIAPCEMDLALREVRGSEVVGTDASGVVEQVGRDVKGFRVGDEVYYHSDRTRSDCHSEFHVVDERLLAFKPVTMSFEDAASMPGASLKAYEYLFDKLKVNPEESRGKTLLMTNSKSTVSAMATQLASQLTNLLIFAVVANKEEAEYMKEMGAHYILDESFDFNIQLKQYGLEKVNYIVNVDGQAFCISPYNEGERLKEISELIDAGALKTLMTANLGFIDEELLAQGHRMVEGRRILGKVVLNFSE